MGVAGLWDIISPAEKKYSLEELALDHIDRYNKRLRVAIDVSIWGIQAQSTQGGLLRTMFYRCCRLFSLGIRPVFVFDGDQRPAYKRNKNINTSQINTTEHHLLVAMLKLFNYATWQAAGEAEAECAVLQRLGYVDLIFTTDVDVFLFGGQRMARKWPSADYEPISCVDIDWIQETTALDRSDLIFMALFGGSDYGSGANRIGIHYAQALARLKYHWGFLDTIEEAVNNKNNNNLTHDDIEIQLQQMLDDLQHELSTNQLGYLRRRKSTIDLNTLIDHEQLISLAKDWIHPKTAILDATHIEAAKTMNFLLNDEHVTPDFVSLASFCQVQFEWSKAVTIDKFARKIYPGYMLQRILYQAKQSIRHPGLSQQQGHHHHLPRQHLHPFFDKYYYKHNKLHANSNVRQMEKTPMDLYRIHSMEAVSRRKHGTRSQKLSRCRVEWQSTTLETFLIMVKRELLDDIGCSVDSTQMTSITQAEHVDVSPEMNFSQDIDSLGSTSSMYKRQDSENDDLIDLTAERSSSSSSPPLSVAPAIGPPTIKKLTTSTSSSSSKSTTTNITNKSEKNWMYDYCNPKKCCRQWIGFRLLRKVYPRMIEDHLLSAKSKRHRKNTKLDEHQKTLESYIITSSQSCVSDDDIISNDDSFSNDNTIPSQKRTTQTALDDYLFTS
ncbi:uncharacterized protein BX664DRAFT_286746 [Halteromyces radiatus]|uniref:uncharacterized protein n=1 Tax=Halteromyces radiatus TaxID=101107 RepID=UPI0022201941|nr:uncharacterized protein BX664DRAFT_286746 [Halteromyces radiatus]KAI8078681.1 hypothetical protein BX664DRAFT_286746 [Halteromyces radiatus]